MGMAFILSYIWHPLPAGPRLASDIFCQFLMLLLFSYCINFWEYTSCLQKYFYLKNNADIYIKSYFFVL